MTLWILCVLGLYVVQTLLPSWTRYLSQPDRAESLNIALRGRDNPPPMPVIGGRLERALHNMEEALPVFLTLSILTIIRGPEVEAEAINGAIVFFVARVLYVPAYASAIPGLRSAIWVGGWVGLVMLGSALL